MGDQLKGRRRGAKCGAYMPLVVVEATYDGSPYRGGYIHTPNGVVGIYDQSGRPYTALCVIVDGKLHEVSWDRKFSDRRLKTLARRFAGEVARERSEHSSPRQVEGEGSREASNPPDSTEGEG